MDIRKARPEDRGPARRLAESLGLDYASLDDDPAWVAEEDGRIAGLVARLDHPDCRELVALGVDPAFRSHRLGRRLVEALAADMPGDIYLATIIPGFFEGCGFVRIPAAPAGMAKDAFWCEGCPKERCTIMVRTPR
jgi:N-acetylglutamate synthase-like GNAT family acetyltransferase